LLSYIAKRLGYSLVTLWTVVTLTFFLMHLVPGNPFDKEGRMPPEIFENLMKYYHLDQPLFLQYIHYLKSLLSFDLGPSIKSDVLTVNDMIAQGFPVSFQLGVYALFLAVFFGILLGTIAALFHNRWQDYLSMLIAIIGISVPGFILGTLLIHYLAVGLGLFPPALWGTWQHAVLPSFALSFMPMAYIARLMRSSMLEVLEQDYILTARAKGLRESVIIFKHALRNALLPVVTVLGVIAANLVTGSFIIEHLFGIPGMGEMFVKSIFTRDYPAIMGVTVFYSAILIFLLFVIDIIYTWIDPRIKLAGRDS